MPELAAPQSEPQPAHQEPAVNATLEPPVVSGVDPALTPTEPSINLPQKASHRLRTIVVVVIILALAVAAIVYSTRTSHQQDATVKKDIPYLTYGFQDSGDITPSYPTETSDDVNSGFVDTQLFEGLVGYQDQTKVVPMLATSWYNPNDSTWVFNLRHGVRFHSGRIMTATDVKYSLDYAVAHQSDNSNATTLILASSIKQVDVVNPYQVKITTNGPDAVLLNRLAYLYILDSKAKLGDPNAGTGPYVVKPGTIKPNATSLDLAAFNSYWGGHVYTRAVHFHEDATESQLASDTANGKFDMAGNFNASELAQIKAKVTYYKQINVSDLGDEYLELNVENTNSPLHALAARQAITYALDVPAIIKAGSLIGTPVSQLIPSVLPGYDPSIIQTPYNPAKARQLLATVPNGATPLTLSYTVGDEDQVTEVAKELDAVGFNIKLQGIPDVGTLVNMAVAGQGDIFKLGYSSNTLDGLDIINNTVAGTQLYTSSELTSFINQASSTLDPAARIVVLQKIERLVASDVPTIALYTQTNLYVLTKPYVFKLDLPAVDTSTYLWQVYQQ